MTLPSLQRSKARSGTKGAAAMGAAPSSRSDGGGSISSGSRSSGGPHQGTIDACYALCRVDILQKYVKSHDVIIHTYDMFAPTWCDIFDFHRSLDSSWFPLERLTGASDPYSDDEGDPSPALLSAYRARTVQARQAAAEAVVAAGGPDATDARLLLAELTSYKSAAAKRKALVSAAAVAVAAAAQEQAGVSPAAKTLASTLGVVHERDDGSFLYWLGPRARAGVRATRALMRCCYGEALAQKVKVQEPRKEWMDWLHDTDENSFTGHGIMHVVKMWSIACRPDLYDNAKEQHRELLQFGLRHVGLDQSTTSMLMVLPYSFYFAAYTAEDEPGGGPDGHLVRAALKAIKFVDPSGWVPRLMIGLELADPTAGPSILVGSKQEAMAACRLLGRCWREATHRQQLKHDSRRSSRRPSSTSASSSSSSSSEPSGVAPAMARLLKEFKLVLPAQGADMRLAAARFNNFREVALPLTTQKAAPGTTACLDETLDIIRVSCLMMAALGDATHNLPQVHTDGWQHRPSILKCCGHVSPEDMSRFLVQHAHLPARLTSLMEGLRDRLAADDERMREVDRWERMLPVFRPCQLRWLWQAGKADAALQLLQSWVQKDPSISSSIADVHAFLAAEAQAAALAPGSIQSTPASAPPVPPANDCIQLHTSSTGALSRVATPTLHGSSNNGASTSSSGGTGSGGDGKSSGKSDSSSNTGTISSVAAVTAAVSESCGAIGTAKLHCAVCSQMASMPRFCGGCGKVRYCGRDCALLHWRQEHRGKCSKRLLKSTA